MIRFLASFTLVIVVSIRASAMVHAEGSTFANAEFTQIEPLAVAGTTGDKAQSKIWNHDGRWWSIMPDSQGTWLWRLDDDTWTPTLQLSLKTSYRSDIVSDGELAHVLLFDRGNSQLATLQYSSPGSYEFWSQRPSLVPVALPVAEIATIAIDSRDRLWLASDNERESTIEVRYSDSEYSSFSTPITLGTNVDWDDISAITALPTGSVGVLWSDQKAQRFFFREHSDDADAEDWHSTETVAESAALPIGDGMADDHLNFATARDGTLYAAVKTSYDVSDQTQIGLLVRRPGGQWDETLYRVDTDGTRPVVLLDESINRLLVAYTERNSGGDILFRETDLGDIQFSEAHVLLGGVLNNVTSTRQTVHGELVVMASSGDRAYAVMLTYPLPEPRSAHILASGAIGLMGCRRRSRRSGYCLTTA